MNTEIQNFVRKKTETENAPGKQTLYYLDRFQRIEENPRKLDWNWAAAIGGGLWMLYRRMYWEGALTFLILIGAGYLADYFLKYDPTGAASIAVIGLQGNKLYYGHVQRQLKKGSQRGGVDLITPLLVLAGFILVIGFCYFLD